MDSTNSQSQAAATTNNHRHLYNHSAAAAAATMHMGRSMIKISQVYGGNLVDLKDKLM